MRDLLFPLLEGGEKSISESLGFSTEEVGEIWRGRNLVFGILIFDCDVTEKPVISALRDLIWQR